MPLVEKHLQQSFHIAQSTRVLKKPRWLQSLQGKGVIIQYVPAEENATLRLPRTQLGYTDGV